MRIFTSFIILLLTTFALQANAENEVIYYPESGKVLLPEVIIAGDNSGKKFNVELQEIGGVFTLNRLTENQCFLNNDTPQLLHTMQITLIDIDQNQTVPFEALTFFIDGQEKRLQNTQFNNALTIAEFQKAIQDALTKVGLNHDIRISTYSQGIYSQDGQYRNVTAIQLESCLEMLPGYIERNPSQQEDYLFTFEVGEPIVSQ